MQINKETKLYGSFSRVPGNNGCIFFNNAFKKYNINAIYKSFYSDNIELSIACSKHLNFSGFALSMPHKITCIKYLDILDHNSEQIGAVNTVINNNGVLIGYNTDYLAVNDFFQNNISFDKETILVGNGGFSKAIQKSLNTKNILFSLIERNNFDILNNIKNKIVINSTPLDLSIDSTNILIDLRTNAKYGKIVADIQAKYQFELYTGLKYE